MQRITPFLWFDGRAEEAAYFYVSVFKNSKLGKITRCGDAGPGPKESVMSVTFHVEGQEFMALSGGPTPTFSIIPPRPRPSRLPCFREISWTSNG